MSIGSSAENIEAAVDYIKETRGEEAGVLHLNVLRPFPEKALVEALRGKQQIIVLERTDEPAAGGGPLVRDIRAALSKALENSRTASHPEVPAITPDEMPRIFYGAYGLGSRDFRGSEIGYVQI